MTSRWIVFALLVCAAEVAFGQSFPDQLTGTWTGTMHLFKDGKIRDSVRIRFSVQPGKEPHTWSWKTEYLSEKMPMTKDYTLRQTDGAPNTFVLDEGGGVALNDYLFGNKLYSVFETHEVMLTSTYELRDGVLIFEVTSGKKTGTSTDVVNYAVQHLQRAVLRRSPG